jgi:hypothetical protein
LEEDAVRANELLFWLSARRQGSWQQFRAAVEDLHSDKNDSSADGIAFAAKDEFPLHQQLRVNLECLAHVEFFAQHCEQGWRIVPPTFAVHPTEGGVRAVLCGARSPDFRDRVLRIGERVRCEILDVDGAPQVIRLITQEASTLQEAALQAGACIQFDAPLAILSYLPPCEPPSPMQSQSEFPKGSDWNIHEFDTINLAWRKIDHDQAENVRFGVLRFLIHFQRPRYFLRWKSMTFEISRAVAIYLLLHRHRRAILQYNYESAELSLPAICRPPRLLERALVLCSGLIPNYDSATAKLIYSDVPPGIAHFAAELLRQSLT